jgi:hypothetical protein
LDPGLTATFTRKKSNHFANIATRKYRVPVHNPSNLLERRIEERRHAEQSGMQYLQHSRALNYHWRVVHDARSA